MKKILVMIVGILITMMFCACSNSEVINNEEDSANAQEENINNEENDEMDRKIEIVIGSKNFTATLEDNDTARNFQTLLPQTINMNDVNNNEKAYNFSQSIAKDKSTNPGRINTGDIMCWSNNVLVLFYDSFSTPYTYVKIGSVDDITGFVEALGSGSVEVTIK